MNLSLLVEKKDDEEVLRVFFFICINYPQRCIYNEWFALWAKWDLNVQDRKSYLNRWNAPIPWEWIFFMAVHYEYRCTCFSIGAYEQWENVSCLKCHWPTEIYCFQLRSFESRRYQEKVD